MAEMITKKADYENGNDGRTDVVRRILVSILLLAYFVTALIAASPASALRTAALRFLKPPINYVGLYGEYDLFAPVPTNFNQTWTAVVEFEDGSKKTWAFPRSSNWKHDDLKRHFMFAWIEWQYYMIEAPWLMNDAARYVAWLHRNPRNQPVAVVLYHDYTIIRPEAADKPAPPVTAPTMKAKVFYKVRPEDLR